MHAKPGVDGQALLVQELGSSRGGQGGPPQPGQGSQSAQAARHVLQAVHTFVALTQIQQVTVVTLLLVLFTHEGCCMVHSSTVLCCLPMKICWRATTSLTPLDQPSQTSRQARRVNQPNVLQKGHTAVCQVCSTSSSQVQCLHRAPAYTGQHACH